VRYIFDINLSTAKIGTDWLNKKIGRI